MTSLHGLDGPGPLRPQPVGQRAETHEHQRVGRSRLLATGTLACPGCDAPVAPVAGPLSPADALSCPFCDHAAAVRDFLSLAAPSRPARVVVRVVERLRLTPTS